MTNEDRAALEAAAKVVYAPETWPGNEEDFDAGPWYDQDKAFIFLANPTAILELLAESAALREALGTADTIISENPGEDACRHGVDVLECAGEDGEPCIDRSRRELISGVLAAPQVPE